MGDLLQTLIRELKAGRSCRLITILSRRGSVPRKEGAHLLLTADGTRIGTIGGGGLEAEALRIAEKQLHPSHGYLKAFTLVEGDDPSDMVCGGNVTLYIEPILPGEGKILSFITEALHISLPVCVIRLLNRPDLENPEVIRGPVGAVRIDGRYQFSASIDEKIMPRLLAWSRVFLNEGEKTIQVLPPEALDFPPTTPWNLAVFELFQVLPRLIIFGGGHLSKALCTMASLCRFRVEVYDDRAEYANKQRFPEAVRTFPIPGYREITALVPMDSHSFVVIATRGHRFDEIVLSQVLPQDLPYIGMVGSRRKNTIVFERLRDQGVSPDDLKNVHAPIGLSIGSETPEEIAVSILAELIQTRANRKQRTDTHP